MRVVVCHLTGDNVHQQSRKHTRASTTNRTDFEGQSALQPPKKNVHLVAKPCIWEQLFKSILNLIKV